MIFDREGYSPAFFRRMWDEHRIACVTYRKFPKEAWPTWEFCDVTGTMPNSETVSRMHWPWSAAGVRETSSTT